MAAGTETDERVRTAVIDELYWDDRVDAANIQVGVSDGRVVLTGTAPTYAALGAAEEDTRAVAFDRIVENRLIVKQPLHMLAPADPEIESNIMNTLRWHSQIDASDIQATAHDGWITLRGTVLSYWQKIKAQEVAAALIGVTGVTNELVVVPTRKYEDRRIAEAIEAALERNVYVDAEMVDVKVTDGVVTIAGSMPDWKAYKVAYDAAKHTPGVIDVINNLTIG